MITDTEEFEFEIEAELYSKQAEYVNSDSDIAIYNGGVGAGKTISNVVLAIKLMIEYPGIDVLIVAPTYGMLEDTVMKEFADRCPKELLSNFTRGAYPIAKFHPTHRGQSTARFRAFNNAGKPKGITVGAAIIDEVTEMEQSVLYEVFRRVRQAGMPNYKRMTTNSDSKDHYVYKDFIEPYLNGTIPTNELHSIHTTTFDNPFLPESYLRPLRRLKENRPGEYLRMVMGEWGDFDEDRIGAFQQVPAFTATYLVAFIDTSFSNSNTSDRTAVSVVGFVPQEGDINYLPIEFTGMSWQQSITHPDVIDGIIMFLDRFRPIETCMESQLGKDSTQVFIDKFRERENVLNVPVKNYWTVFHQTKNKHERIMMEVAGNKDRLFALAGTDSVYLNRVISYRKKVEHDDEIDSLAGAINQWKTSKILKDYIRMMQN